MKQTILNLLNINMGYKKGEKVAIIQQIGKGKNFTEQDKVVNKLLKAYKNIPVTLVQYKPKTKRHGEDPPKEVYQKCKNKDILLMPTAYSLSHTLFRKTLCKQGARIASMPTFTVKMFEPNGPLDADYRAIVQRNQQIKKLLLKSRYVRITAKNTDITVEIDQNLIHTDDGILVNKGDSGNLPAGETYVVPKHKGNSNGHITIPKGWGTKYKLTFHIRNGVFTQIQCENQEYANKHIKPLLFAQKDFNVLAELGIGTNEKVTKQYIKQQGWSPLTAEKIIGSAHFANGNSKAMGGKNDVPQHIDWVVPDVKIEYNRVHPE